jgi:uncharacterized membrane protein YedE/YeeE
MVLMAGSFACGLLFGFGLLVSGMINPEKVLGFLDIFGAWDPNLAVVMAVALAVTGAGYALARGHERPLIADRHFWPPDAGIDRDLIVGAAMFGIGWGLVGLCPGPAISNLATLSPEVMVFVAAMIAGMIARDARARREGAQPSASATSQQES